MIGIFDSGSGGLTFLAAMRRRFPEWSYIYYADYEHCPFWEKTPEEIQSFTVAGVEKLFDAGATIVILACNTASAWTLRKLQTEVFPDKKILWVTIPGAEKAVELGLENVTVFATEQTVQSRTYAERVRILDQDTSVYEIALHGDLVREIENLLPIRHCHTEGDFAELSSLYGLDGWQCDDLNWNGLVQKYFGDIHLQSYSEAIILWCTHYSYIRKPLQKLFPSSMLIDPSEEAADKLGIYVKKHSISVSGGRSIKFL